MAFTSQQLIQQATNCLNDFDECDVSQTEKRFYLIRTAIADLSLALKQTLSTGAST